MDEQIPFLHLYTCYSKATSIFQAARKKSQAFSNNIWHVSCFNGTGPFIMPNVLHLGVFFLWISWGLCSTNRRLINQADCNVKSAGSLPAGPAPTFCNSHPIQSHYISAQIYADAGNKLASDLFSCTCYYSLTRNTSLKPNIACSSSDCVALSWSCELQAANIHLYAYKELSMYSREKTSTDNLVTCTLPCLQSLRSKSIFPFHVQDGMI